MNWATQHIANLREGKTVSFRPHGNSMQGRIESGQLVTVAPIADIQTLCVGDIVLCKVNGKCFVHLITAIKNKFPKQQFQISNNKNHVNGWTSSNGIYGKVIRVDP